jgi:hypothetical protein
MLVTQCWVMLVTQCIAIPSRALLGGVITSQWSVMRGQEWGIETSFRLRIMDHLPNTFPSLWVVLFLPWGMHTYVEIFAYIVNIIWVSLEIVLWETIHSSRCEVINWSLREILSQMPWGHHESNRVIEHYSSLVRHQKHPNAIWTHLQPWQILE